MRCHVPASFHNTQQYIPWINQYRPLIQTRLPFNCSSWMKRFTCHHRNCFNSTHVPSFPPKQIAIFHCVSSQSSTCCLCCSWFVWHIFPLLSISLTHVDTFLDMCSSHHIKSSKQWSKQSRWILNTILSFLSLALVYNEPGARWKDRASSGTGPWDGALRWGEDGEDVLGIPEELHLGWRLWVCVGGVRLGAARTQTGTGRPPKVLLHGDSEMRTPRRTFNPNTN